MADYLVRRIVHSAVSLVTLVVVVFFLARLTGNPADLYLPLDAPASIRQEFIAQHGFDDPTIVQFGRFLASAARLDFGESLRLGRPALDLALEAFPTTLTLAVVAMFFALSVAIVTGALGAARPYGAFDRAANVISLIGASVPNFWIAIVGILVFAVRLHWVPTGGVGSVSQWILPIGVLAIRPCGVIVQVVRGSMISALSSAYVKTAMAKGVPNRPIIFVHALRNAMLPVITVAGDQAAGIINGAVIIESIFGLPGIGRLMIQAIYERDFAVLQASIIVTASAIFILNVLIDLAYVALDPRVRHT